MYLKFYSNNNGNTVFTVAAFFAELTTPKMVNVEATLNTGTLTASSARIVINSGGSDGD